MEELNFPTWENNGKNEDKDINNIENIDFPNSSMPQKKATKEELLRQKTELEKMKKTPDNIPDILKY